KSGQPANAAHGRFSYRNIADEQSLQPRQALEVLQTWPTYLASRQHQSFKINEFFEMNQPLVIDRHLIQIELLEIGQRFEARQPRVADRHVAQIEKAEFGSRPGVRGPTAIDGAPVQLQSEQRR